MSDTLEFFFDYVSPMSYFAFHRIKGVQARTGCEVAYRPMLLSTVMKETGNRPPGMISSKGDFYKSDFKRHAKRYGIPFNYNPDFPLNTFIPLTMTVGLSGSEDQQRFMQVCFFHMWAEPKNLADESVLDGIFQQEGFDADHLKSLAANTDHRKTLKANTHEALERGVFGAPTFFVGDELYFGQDRLDFVEDAVSERLWV